MGVLQRFERRLEGLVEGAFARVFKGVVEPVEVAAALQREAADKRAILGPGRTLVPNRYVVELGQRDYERLSPYEGPLTDELAAMVREHVAEQQWTTFGSVHVALEQVDDLETGMFRVTSAVEADNVPNGRPARQVPAAPPQPDVDPVDEGPSDRAIAGHAVPPRRAAPAKEARLVDERTGAEIPLHLGEAVIGRGDQADIRLADTGVSRRHARVGWDGDRAVITDMGSTNGTKVNGRGTERAVLRDGDTVQVGTTVLVLRVDG